MVSSVAHCASGARGGGGSGGGAGGGGAAEAASCCSRWSWPSPAWKTASSQSSWKRTRARVCSAHERAARRRRAEFVDERHEELQPGLRVAAVGSREELGHARLHRRQPAAVDRVRRRAVEQHRALRQQREQLRRLAAHVRLERPPVAQHAHDEAVQRRPAAAPGHAASRRTRAAPTARGIARRQRRTRRAACTLRAGRRCCAARGEPPPPAAAPRAWWRWRRRGRRPRRRRR